MHYVPYASYGTRCPEALNTLRPIQNGRHFADDTFKRIFLKENVRISIEISLKFVPKSPIDNIPALVQIMAWRRPGDKPISEAMMVSLLTHICVARPQCVNKALPGMMMNDKLVAIPHNITACHCIFPPVFTNKQWFPDYKQNLPTLIQWFSRMKTRTKLYIFYFIFMAGSLA